MASRPTIEFDFDNRGLAKCVRKLLELEITSIVYFGSLSEATNELRNAQLGRQEDLSVLAQIKVVCIQSIDKFNEILRQSRKEEEISAQKKSGDTPLIRMAIVNYFTFLKRKESREEYEYTGSSISRALILATNIKSSLITFVEDSMNLDENVLKYDGASLGEAQASRISLRHCFQRWFVHVIE